MQQILIVDDDTTLGESLRDGLADEGYAADVVTSGEAALEKFELQHYDLVFIDYRLPGMDGLEVLEKLRLVDPNIMVIFMTAHGDGTVELQTIRKKAKYVPKPFELGSVIGFVALALDNTRRKWESDRLLQKFGPDPIVGESQALKEVFRFVEKVSQSTSTGVLVQGESGTGKELVARAIHHHSFDTQDHPFIEINCAAMPENLLESELFGYEQGAFTDAKRTKKGIVELAHGGSLFLDEIGEMGLGLQSKLLRFIETKRFKRVGGQQDLEVDIRVIAASNQDLKSMVADNRFRPDLYYRLSVLPVTIPPLRQRREDIALLAEYFVEKLNRELKRAVTGFAPEALTYLTQYAWPGNVRELRNVIERAMILESEDEILTAHLPAEVVGTAGEIVPVSAGTSPAGAFRPQPLDDVEREHIKRTLDYFDGNKSEAARVLGISRQTLREKLKNKNPE